MFCTKCGKQLQDDAVFCDGCGSRIGAQNQPVPPVPSTSDSPAKKSKCPYCGEILPYDAITCPSCGNEIGGKKVTASVQALYEKVSQLSDPDRQIEAIKLFPIPNNREDIIELMTLAAGNFDAKNYLENRSVETVSAAWLTKIDQCYEKGKLLFKNKQDVDAIERIYSSVHNKTTHALKTKLIFVLAGIVLAVGGTVGMLYGNPNGNSVLTMLFLAMGVLGVISIIIGLKKKKTNKQVQDAANAKARAQEIKASKRK